MTNCMHDREKSSNRELPESTLERTPTKEREGLILYLNINEDDPAERIRITIN